MVSVDDEIGYTQDVIDGCCHQDNYAFIYYSSNELLNELFNKIDIKDKTCLSVIGSGDQSFHLINRGARSVDLFDKNKLTIYYYYFRMWVIKYLNKFYPDMYICKDYIENLLSHVNPSDKFEKFVYDYWMKFAETFKYYDEEELEELFSINNDPVRNEIKDLSLLKKYFDQNDCKFYNIDISRKNINLNKKYDIIFCSNIHDYVDDGMIDFKDNLKRHIKDDGKIIFTHVARKDRWVNEIEIFDEEFDIHPIDEILYRMERRSPGYVYTKK